MYGYDFIYDIEKKKINELATRGSSQTTSGSSYNRIAYNVFRSLYPPEMKIFNAESMGFADTAKQYVDYLQSKRKSGEKLNSEQVKDEILKTVEKLKDKSTPQEEREKIESIAGSTAAIKKSGQLANRIWARVRDYVKKHESEGVTDQMVQSWILDPGNETGQKILSGIRGPGGSAQVVGIDGKPVTGWSKELWSGNAGNDSETDSTEEDKEQKEKSDIYKDSISKTKEQQKVVDKYKGRSQISEENRKYFTDFIKKVLKKAHSSGILKTISIVGKDQSGRSSSRDMSAYEFAVTQAVKPIISSIAYDFADIAVNALVQYELLSADPSFKPNWTYLENTDDEEKPDLKNINHPIYKSVKPIDKDMTAKFAAEIFEKMINKMELTGVKLLPSTVKDMSRKWIKVASKNLEESGFDDNLAKELEYYHQRIKNVSPGETYKISSAVKQAITNTTQDIADDLYKNTEFIKTFVSFIIDSEEIKRTLRQFDPTIREKERELKKIQQQRHLTRQKFGSISKRSPKQKSSEESEIGESIQTFKKYIEMQ